jgi:hypothetical protein
MRLNFSQSRVMAHRIRFATTKQSVISAQCNGLVANISEGVPHSPIETYGATDKSMTSPVCSQQGNLPFTLIAFSGGKSALDPLLDGCNQGIVLPIDKSVFPWQHLGLHSSWSSKSHFCTDHPSRAVQIPSCERSTGEIQFRCTYPRDYWYGFLRELRLA